MIARNGQGGCNCGGTPQAPQQPQAQPYPGMIGINPRAPQPTPQQPNQDWRYQMTDQGGWGGQYNNPNMYTTRAQPGYRPTGFAPSPETLSPQANIFQRGPTPDMMHSMSMFRGLFG